MSVLTSGAGIRVRRNLATGMRRKRSYLPADERRAQILEHAKTSFFLKGFHRASVGEICKRAGVSRATLYQYFDNKRDVLLALLGDVVKRVRKVLAARVPLEKLDIDRRRLSVNAIETFCQQRMRELMDAIFVNEKTIRLILRDARGLDRVVEQVIGEIDDLVLSALEREIRAGQKLGVLGPGDPAFLALHNLGGIEKVVLSALASCCDEQLDLGAVVRDTVRIQLHGMLHKEVRR